MPSAIHKVLLIDDSEIDNLINQQVVQKDGFADHIDVVTSGREALEHLRKAAGDGGKENLPEVILLDIRMPNMNGFEFLEAFESLPASVQERCRIFMLSSSMHRDDVERAEKNPRIERFLSKPLSQSRMQEIRQHLEGLETG